MSLDRSDVSFHPARSDLLTEQQINRSFRNLLRDSEVNDDVFARAESLLDELRPESPLRHRLSSELEELRQRWLQTQS
jgi:hypothetical protein